MSRRGKTLGEMFPRAMGRWPRTFFLAMILVFAAVGVALMSLSIRFFGSAGPLYVSAASIIYIIVVVAVIADIRDRKGPS